MIKELFFDCFTNLSLVAVTTTGDYRVVDEDLKVYAEIPFDPLAPSKKELIEMWKTALINKRPKNDKSPEWAKKYSYMLDVKSLRKFMQEIKETKGFGLGLFEEE
jgi:hypothetical protein